MKTKLVYLSVLLVSILMVSNVSAQKDRKHSKMHKAGHECPMMSELTEAQQTKIKEINLEKRQKMTVMRADLKIKQAELNKMRLSTETPEKDINAKVDEISTLRGEMQKERLAAERAIMNELTPEQQVKYKSHHGNSKHHHSSKQHNCDHHKSGAHDCPHSKGEGRNKGHQHNCPHSK